MYVYATCMLHLHVCVMTVHVCLCYMYVYTTYVLHVLYRVIGKSRKIFELVELV